MVCKLHFNKAVQEKKKKNPNPANFTVKACKT